ncbi:MAG: helix-turn-helix domain-containing protein [Clostridia bacterium]|nr:helix-turn-helix domain-containing protein [Clostridia bacterium]
MFTNKAKDLTNNLCGKNVAAFRKAMGISQRALADTLQLLGLDVDKNAIQRIESGKRFVTDIELVFLSRALHCSLQDLVNAVK